LKKYPQSLFTMISTIGMKKSFDGNINGFQTEFSSVELENICHFYMNGKWKNPHLWENKFEATSIDGNFYQRCEFLGLPDDFEEPTEETTSNYSCYEYDDDDKYEEFEEPDDEEYKYTRYMERKEAKWFADDYENEMKPCPILALYGGRDEYY
jgi:hypothetical protein